MPQAGSPPLGFKLATVAGMVDASSRGEVFSFQSVWSDWWKHVASVSKNFRVRIDLVEWVVIWVVIKVKIPQLTQLCNSKVLSWDLAGR